MRLFRHGLVDSTSERAFVSLAEGRARHGDVHVADGQSAGRGRLGRRWVSPSGEGLYLSLVLLPETPPHPAALTMGAGLAVHAAIVALGASRAELKWPNDVLVPDDTGRAAKLAGILVEARGLDPLHPHAVVGVGLNVHQRTFPPELLSERRVTSLSLLGMDVSRERALEALLDRLLPSLELACREPAVTAADYARTSGLLGRPVRVEHGRVEARGRLEALTLSGLELAAGNGERTRVPLEHARTVEPLG